MSLDQTAVWAQFPAIQRQDHVLLDNASGSQTLGVVADSIRDYLVTNNAQLGASYSVSKVCSGLFAEAHEAAARFVHARPDEVVFGASATQLLRNLALTLRFRPGDEIVVSTLDHEANITPWLDMARRQDLQVRWWRPQDRSSSSSPELLVADLERLLSPRTKLVACTHASNFLGTITDVKAIADAAHAHGALVCVDGVAYVPHRPVDVQALGVDMYVFSWHKVFGPHLATLYTSWAAQTHMGSLGPFFGPSVTLDNKVGLSAASYELCHSVTRVVSYLRELGDNPWDAISGHEREILDLLLSFLKSRPNVTIYGTTETAEDRRLPIVSFTVEGWHSKSLVEAIEEETNYCIRWGSFYSQRLVRDILNLGEDGVVRVSMVHYNTKDEVMGLILAICQLLETTS